MRVVLAWILVGLTLSTAVNASERHLARFIFQEAEEAMAKQDFATALDKLEAAEQAMGKTNPLIAYLRVQARAALWERNPDDYSLAKQLKTDTDLFLRRYGQIEGAREVYSIDQRVGGYLAGAQAELKKRMASAESGDIASMKFLVESFRTGQGAPEDPAKASAWEKRLAAAEAQEYLRRAEAGEIDAMKAVIERYNTGEGVPKDLAKAQAWEERLEAAKAQEDLERAEAGDIAAMAAVVARYNSGTGLQKDESSANAWQKKLDSKNEQVRAEKAEEQRRYREAAQRAKAQQKIQEIDFWQFQNEVHAVVKKTRQHNPDMVSSAQLLWTTQAPFASVLDLVSAPTKLIQVQLLKREAEMRSSAWGNPDSMIAQALTVEKAARSGAAANSATPVFASR